MVPSFGPDGFKIEYNNAKTITDVAINNGANYTIFSTLLSVIEISCSEHVKVSRFNPKVKAK
jgi:hypothetical protein